jgi:hypothetical protein
MEMNIDKENNCELQKQNESVVSTIKKIKKINHPTIIYCVTPEENISFLDLVLNKNGDPLILIGTDTGEVILHFNSEEFTPWIKKTENRFIYTDKHAGCVKKVLFSEEQQKIFSSCESKIIIRDFDKKINEIIDKGIIDFIYFKGNVIYCLGNGEIKVLNSNFHVISRKTPFPSIDTLLNKNPIIKLFEKEDTIFCCSNNSTVVYSSDLSSEEVYKYSMLISFCLSQSKFEFCSKKKYVKLERKNGKQETVINFKKPIISALQNNNWILIATKNTIEIYNSQDKGNLQLAMDTKDYGIVLSMKQIGNNVYVLLKK